MITVKDTNYNLKLSIRGWENLEKKMGMNPVNVLMKMANDATSMPNISDLALIVHEALQPYNHGMSLDDTYTLIDDWFEEGHTLTDLLQLVVSLFMESGLIPKEQEEDKGKNAKKASK